MKKILLLMTFILVSYSYGQLSCSAAVDITTNGTITCPAITGSYETVCALNNATNEFGIWYKYTATANGEVTLSSDLSVNDGTTYSDDTRVSILTGDCTNLECYAYNDDIDDNNYLSEVVFPVEAGTTYYIQWDNNWSALGFQFTFNFNAASCIRPLEFGVYRSDTYTKTSFNAYWDAAIGSPASYDLDWSSDFTVAAGAGTIVNTTNTVTGNPDIYTANPTGLPTSENIRYYVRSNCGASQSGWVGPYFAYLAQTAPYNNTFDDSNKNFTDGFLRGTGWSLFRSTATSTPPNAADTGEYLIYSFNSTSAPVNYWLYSRAFDFAANEQVTVTFKSRLWVPSGTPSPMTINVTIGDAQSSASQTTSIQSHTISGTSYQTFTSSYTVPTAGVYHIGFNNNSAAGATATFLLLDTFAISSVLGTEDLQNEVDNFYIYPNPTSDVINFKSNSTIQEVKIFDLQGKLVYQQKLENESNSVDIRFLNSGVYIVESLTENGTSINSKLVKE